MFSVGVTDCKANSPVHPIFNWRWSPKNNLSQHCSAKPSPKTSSSTACWLGALSTEWVIVCMQTTQTNCIRVQKHIKLYNNPTPLEFNQATPNAYQTIAPYLCNNMTLSLTEWFFCMLFICKSNSYPWLAVENNDIMNLRPRGPWGPTGPRTKTNQS